MTRPIYIITHEIWADWKQPAVNALPYLTAMGVIDQINERYFEDTAKSIVSYFLDNAITWRGAEARRLKAELRSML